MQNWSAVPYLELKIEQQGIKALKFKGIVNSFLWEIFLSTYHVSITYQN
jgi:hypothetical protein